MPVVQAIQEAELGGLLFEASPGKISKRLSEK
jgi:hypothetical protein